MNHLQLLQQTFGLGEGRALYRWVMEECFAMTHTQILLGKDKTLSPTQREKLDNIVLRLLRHEPVQYVVGHTTFCGHRFRVTPSVLIPRPETEQLVHLTSSLLPPSSRILDLGTGSGCIAISLALMGHRVTAVDISPEALAVARSNAESLAADVRFVEGDALHPASLWAHPEGYDCIVSNPPYICQREAQEMEPHVLDHEPHTALFVPDDDPLLFYRAIARLGRETLRTGGCLCFECNRLYASDVAAMMRQTGYADVQVIHDDYQNERFVIGQCERK